MSTSSLNHQLSLAGGLFLLKPGCTGEDILAYTLAELLILDVIGLKDAYTRANPKDPARILVRLIEKGVNYDSFSPTPHQSAFLSHLTETERLPIHRLARQLVPQKKPIRFKKNVLLPHLADEGLYQELFGFYKFTTEGKMLKKNLKSQLKRFRSLIKQKDFGYEMKELVSDLGPLILLTPKVAFKALVELNATWLEAIPPQSSKNSSLYSWYGIESLAPVSTFKLLDTYMVSFERSYMGVQSSLITDYDDGLDFYDDYF